MIAIVIISVEMISRFFVWCKLLQYTPFPTSNEKTFLDYDEQLGHWHVKNSKSSLLKSGRYVNYSTNSFGMRDKEREVVSKDTRRVVVLGDSFVEGLGLNDTERFTNILESSTGIQHLNFGCSGYDPVRELLLYENLVVKFSHSDVFIFFLPLNDFYDTAEHEIKNYMPIAEKINGTYAIKYIGSYKTGSDKMKREDVIKNSINNYSYFLNITRWNIHNYKHKGDKKFSDYSNVTYDNFSQDQMDVVIYCLKRIVEAAKDKKVYLFIIPMLSDFKFYEKAGYNFKLIYNLSKIEDVSSNFKLIDLLIPMYNEAKEQKIDLADYSLPDDLHWGTIGNKVCAKIISNILYHR